MQGYYNSKTIYFISETNELMDLIMLQEIYWWSKFMLICKRVLNTVIAMYIFNGADLAMIFQFGIDQGCSTDIHIMMTS